MPAVVTATASATASGGEQRDPRAEESVAFGPAPHEVSLAQHVADAAHGVDQARLATGLGLAAQVADVDLERVGRGREVVAPDLVEDELAREDASWVLHEDGQAARTRCG